jgi:hypothetical protein
VPPERSFGVLIGIEQPQGMRVGDAWKLAVEEWDTDRRVVRGGSLYHVAFVRSGRTRIDLSMTASRSGARAALLSVRVSSEGGVLGPADGVEVTVAAAGQPPVQARHVPSRKAFQARIGVAASARRIRVTAIATRGENEVRETADLSLPG